jgi:YfiH family protein
MSSAQRGEPETMEWRERDGVEWIEADLPRARVAFSSRLGGVSEPPFDSLNLGLLTEDDPEAVRANRRTLCAALGLEPDRVVIGRQVHGAELAAHAGPQRPAPFAVAGQDPPKVDGHVLADPGSEPGLALLVFVADCLPIALSGAGGIAMLHGGWRGLAAGIIGRGCRAVAARAAAIGPAIGPCCYEVGDEVLAAFAPLGLGSVGQAGKLDLGAIAAALLEREGVDRIDVSGICTRCESERFFSHRGQGPRTGRQAGLIWGAE